jgi:hypothetical protein
MKLFKNRTVSEKENAIKVGSSVPDDAANIAYFINEQLSPKNNLTVIDISSSIPENKISLDRGVKTYYANELGVLEDETGNTIFPSADISISDSFLLKDYQTEMLKVAEINSDEFFHYYYVSRFFISAPANYSTYGLSEYIPQSLYSALNIKVLNSQNQDHVDINTGRKKYKILLDPYATEANSEDTERPYKVIIGLDSSDPINLKLVYDKVECDSDGKVTSQYLRYSESINAVQYFKPIAEETFVVDNNYDKKVFSVKKFNKKYSDIFNTNINSTGYQVFVPKRAIADNRTYEVFNWRLVARSNQSVNLELIDYFSDLETTTGIKQKTVNVGVLYDSLDTQSLEVIKPYVFYRLEKSPFNFSKFAFKNPVSEAANNLDKTKANYWMIDIQSIDSLENFDILTFCPTKKLSEKANILINNYVKIHNGTLLVDGSLYPSGEAFISPDISMATFTASVVPTYYGYVTSSKILDETKNGGWNIDSTIFENQDYGIFGLKKGAYKQLSNINSSKSFLNIGISSSSNSSVGALFEFPTVGDAVAQGNIIFTSFSFLEYCNSIYSVASKSTVLKLNNESSVFEENDTSLISAVVEGPFKLLYNSVSFAMYSRSYASRVIDTRSSLFNFVGEWNSSWVMNQDALLTQEKEELFVNVTVGTNETRYTRSIVPSPLNIGEYYLRSLTDSLPTYQRDKISFIDLDSVEFFIEVTNPDVIIANSTSVSSSIQENIASSYSLFKVPSSKNFVYAYTDTISPIINIPDGFGPYVVKEIPSLKSSNLRLLNNNIDPTNYFAAYPFELQTAYSYQTATDKPLGFNGTYSSNIRIRYQGQGQLQLKRAVGTVVRNYTVIQKGEPTLIDAGGAIPGQSQNDVPCVNLTSGRDSVFVSSDLVWRNFDYTWDLDNGNVSSTWVVGTTGEYVKYIKSMLKAGGFYGGAINTSYDQAASTAVSAFQNRMRTSGVRFDGIVDGKVDSQTKSLFVSAMSLGIINLTTAQNLCKTNGVSKYFDAALSQGDISEINSGGKYRRISYSGGGLGTQVTRIQDVIFFTIPDGAETVKSIKINFGTIAGWNNVTVVSYGYAPINHAANNISFANTINNSAYKGFTVNKKPDASGNVTLSMANLPVSECKYGYIYFRTNDTVINQAKYGNAEGYQIRGLRCDIVGNATTSDPVYGDPAEIEVPVSETYNAFPSLTKPEIEDIANYWVENNPKVYYDGNNLKSTQSGYLIFTVDTEKYYSWNGSSWSQVTFAESTEKNIKFDTTVVTKIVDAYVNATTSEKFSSLSALKDHTVKYDTNTIKTISLTFGSIVYSYLNKSYTETLSSSTSLSTASFTAGSGVVFDFTKPLYVDLNGSNSVTLNSVTSETGSNVASPLTVLSINYLETNPASGTATRVTIETSATYYSGSNVVTTPLTYINQYVMKNLKNVIVPKKESITTLDGTLLLCNELGKPVGIPTGAEISSYFSSTATEQEKDARLGFVYVKNRIPEQSGFVYGFYDFAQKEFLGDTVAYVDMITRGINNIFLAVVAYDSDGNTQNIIDYIGPKVSTTFIPTNVPIKKICPVYSVKYNSGTAIKIGSMASYVDKKQAWPLVITSGSFTKSVEIPQSIYDDWKSDYANQTLIATYDTTIAKGINWSNIFGRGYYDVKNEKPIIVSDKQIKLRQTPLVVWPEPSSYQNAIAQLFKPQIEVYTRDTTSSNWEKLSLSEIRDYNCSSGIIEFNNRVIPSDENLIKVDYVIKNSDLMIYQSNGEAVPLNPFLNSKNIKFNKPLYIYIVPTKINKLSTDSSAVAEYIPLEDYVPSYPYNFTYNSEIFNEYSPKYDPFALPIGIIYFTNNPNKQQTEIYDTRLRGGGIAAEYQFIEIDSEIDNLLSNWDVYPIHGTSYPRGGFVIVRIPDEVKDNFENIEEIYDIIRRNLTAGVSFQVQNLSGELWEI